MHSMKTSVLTAMWGCSYWVRYLAGIWLELPLYAIKAGRWGMVCQCLTMEALYIALVVALCYLNTAATVWTLIVPLVITSFALMLGNWYAAFAQLMPCQLAYPQLLSAVVLGHNCMAAIGTVYLKSLALPSIDAVHEYAVMLSWICGLRVCSGLCPAGSESVGHISGVQHDESASSSVGLSGSSAVTASCSPPVCITSAFLLVCLC